MLACGSHEIGSTDVVLGYIGVALWGAALLVMIPNIIMGSRGGQSVISKCGNFGFFLAYFGSGLVLLPNLIWYISTVDKILFFLVPGMAIGHFCYLFFERMKERRARNRIVATI